MVEKENYARGVSFLGERLRNWRKSLNVKGKELAAQISISQGNLSSIEKGNSLPSAETIAKLHSRTNINIIWLLTGEGSMQCDSGKFATDKDGAVIVDWKLQDFSVEHDAVEQFVKVFSGSSQEKKARILGYLNGADPDP